MFIYSTFLTEKYNSKTANIFRFFYYSVSLSIKITLTPHSNVSYCCRYATVCSRTLHMGIKGASFDDGNTTIIVHTCRELCRTRLLGGRRPKCLNNSYNSCSDPTKKTNSFDESPETGGSKTKVEDCAALSYYLYIPKNAVKERLSSCLRF